MMYKVIVLCNQVLLHENTVNSLIEHMCKILISPGGFQACWVSHALCSSHPVIHPNAAEGVEEEYFAQLNCALNTPKHRGLLATALRKNSLLICKDLKNEEKESVARDYALQRGYSSLAVIPIPSLKKVSYVLVVYGKKCARFKRRYYCLIKKSSERYRLWTRPS